MRRSIVTRVNCADGKDRAMLIVAAGPLNFGNNPGASPIPVLLTRLPKAKSRYDLQYRLWSLAQFGEQLGESFESRDAGRMPKAECILSYLDPVSWSQA
jgi:hypothetical protein